jgi:hypothetical protein
MEIKGLSMKLAKLVFMCVLSVKVRFKKTKSRSLIQVGEIYRIQSVFQGLFG